MNIRLATADDTKYLKKIWLETFSDSEQFVDWNFENNYKPENVMLCEENGKIASCLHLIPYMLTLENKPLKAVYISAVATLPEFRKKGCATAIIRAALEAIKKNNVDVAFLVPAISGFYEKLGFSYILRKKEVCAHFSDFITPDLSFSEPLVQSALEIYLDVCKCKKFYLKRSFKDMQLITDDLLKNTCGYLKILSDNSGYIMYKEFENHIELYEVMAKNIRSKKLLLGYLYSYNKKVRQSYPPVMINVFNPEIKKIIGTYPKDISRKNAYFNLIL